MRCTCGQAYDDASVSPVVRQTLLHWAYELGEADFKQAAAPPAAHPCCTPAAPLLHTLAAPLLHPLLHTLRHPRPYCTLYTFAALLTYTAPFTLLRPSPHLPFHYPVPTYYFNYCFTTPPTISLLYYLTAHAHHYDYPCRLPTVLAGRQARQDARRHLRAAGAAERHLVRRQQEACAHRRRPGCRGATGQGGGRGGEPRKAREAPRGRVIY